MKRIRPFITLLLCAGLVYLLVACNDGPRLESTNQGTDKSADKSTKSATAAPEFELVGLKQPQVKLSSFRGKVVVLNFWATWCPPCRSEIPDFIAAQDRYRAKGVEFVGISLDAQGKSVVMPFVEKMAINYTVLLGDDHVIDQYGGISAIPTTFFIDREGNIINRVEGSVNSQDLDQILDSMLSS